MQQCAIAEEWKCRQAITRCTDIYEEYRILQQYATSEYRQYDEYMQRLLDAFNLSAVDHVMCPTTLSVDWQGYLYDCDFNQMLDLRVEPSLPQQIRDFEAETFAQHPIVTGRHCYGCTAGAGSSCQGALTNEEATT